MRVCHSLDKNIQNMISKQLRFAFWTILYMWGNKTFALQYIIYALQYITYSLQYIIFALQYIKFALQYITFILQ